MYERCIQVTPVNGFGEGQLYLYLAIVFTVVVQHATTGGKEPKQWLSCRDCLWLQQYCPC
jgi:hypothetical protein